MIVCSLDLAKVEPDPWTFVHPIAVFVVFAEGATVLHERATKIKAWLCARNGLVDSQVVLHTDARNVSIRDDVDSVMLIQTKQVIEQPDCLALLYQACMAGVPIVPVNLLDEKNSEVTYNFEVAAPFLRELEANLDATSQRTLAAATGGASATVVGMELARCIPNVISKPLNVDSLTSPKSTSVDGGQFEAQMLDIELTLRRALNCAWGNSRSAIHSNKQFDKQAVAARSGGCAEAQKSEGGGGPPLRIRTEKSPRPATPPKHSLRPNTPSRP